MYNIVIRHIYNLKNDHANKSSTQYYDYYLHCTLHLQITCAFDEIIKIVFLMGFY